MLMQMLPNVLKFFRWDGMHDECAIRVTTFFQMGTKQKI